MRRGKRRNEKKKKCSEREVDIWRLCSSGAFGLIFVRGNRNASRSVEEKRRREMVREPAWICVCFCFRFCFVFGGGKKKEEERISWEEEVMLCVVFFKRSTDGMAS